MLYPGYTNQNMINYCTSEVVFIEVFANMVSLTPKTENPFIIQTIYAYSELCILEN